MVENRQRSNLVQERQKRIGFWAVGILIVFGPALVKPDMERHGGELSVKSGPGNGSFFTINLPLAQWRVGFP